MFVLGCKKHSYVTIVKNFIIRLPAYSLPGLVSKYGTLSLVVTFPFANSDSQTKVQKLLLEFSGGRMSLHSSLHSL